MSRISLVRAHFRAQERGRRLALIVYLLPKIGGVLGVTVAGLALVMIVQGVFS